MKYCESFAAGFFMGIMKCYLISLVVAFAFMWGVPADVFGM